MAALAVVAMHAALIAAWGARGDALSASLPVAGLVITGVYLLGRLGFVTPRLLGGVYSRSRAFERDGRVYEWLGVRAFRFLLLHSPFALLNQEIRPRRAVGERARLESRMEEAETGHLVAFVLTLPIGAAFAAARGEIRFMGWMLLWNLLLNAYPVFLQRWNRNRLNRRSASRARRSPSR